MKLQEQEPQNSSSSPKKMIPPYMKAVSGSLGGIMEACCLQPIDVIKTRLQLDQTGTYRGIVHCGTTVSNTEGVRALWKGLTLFAMHLTLKYTLRRCSCRHSRTRRPGKSATMAGFSLGLVLAFLKLSPSLLLLSIEGNGALTLRSVTFGGCEN